MMVLECLFMKSKSFIFEKSMITFFIFLMTSCSLRYEKKQVTESDRPDFIFQDVKFVRYEKKEKTLAFSAENLEEYTKSNSLYAKKLSFFIFENNELSAKGTSNYLSADQKNEVYSFIDDVSFESRPNDFFLKTKNLKWNAKNEQLVSGKNDTVHITRQIENGSSVDIYGSGLKLDTSDYSFSIRYHAEGCIE